jgi:hypothetical protein
MSRASAAWFAASKKDTRRFGSGRAPPSAAAPAAESVRLRAGAGESMSCRGVAAYSEPGDVAASVDGCAAGMFNEPGPARRAALRSDKALAMGGAAEADAALLAGIARVGETPSGTTIDGTRD